MSNLTNQPAEPRTRRSILVVEPKPDVFAAVHRVALDRGYSLEDVPTAEQAIDVFEQQGAFDCVIARQELDGVGGIDLCAEIAARWPSTVRLLVTDGAELDLAIRALHEGGVYRLLRTPLHKEQLATELEDAMTCADRLRNERAQAEELVFLRDSLTDMMGVLEDRLAHEVASLREVHDLAGRLARAESLEDVAGLAVDAFSKALGGRGVRVELVAPFQDGRIGAESGDLRGARTELELVLDEDGGPAIFVDDASDLTARDRRILGSLVSSTTLAAKSQVHRIEREEAQHATVFALARLAERRDNETGQHLVRVSKYTRLIAEGLRDDGVYVDELTDGFIDDLVRSAPLHDIGKVGIPDQILLKPGKLTAEEWDIMRRHTTIGGDTLRSVIENTPRPGFLRVAHDIALYHHEKWSGAGYPEGLSGLDIPLCARIVALADVYDALTTRRPYKDPWSNQQAFDLILRERGDHFDPAVVDAFTGREALVNEIRIGHPDEDLPGELAA